jgi:hypothetical protein
MSLSSLVTTIVSWLYHLSKSSNSNLQLWSLLHALLLTIEAALAYLTSPKFRGHFSLATEILLFEENGYMDLRRQEWVILSMQ